MTFITSSISPLRRAFGSLLIPGRGRHRDEELARLRKENKALKEANEILKKATVIFANERPR
ncbi:MAG: hypothetical protein LBC70_11075 [Chitinispirillales bacterium]|nr:hypothetical protein [Chitinispirillales bacterium]